MDAVVAVIWAFTPTVIAGLFFWLIMRLLLRADRVERREYQKIEAEERQKLGLPPKGGKPRTPESEPR